LNKIINFSVITLLVLADNLSWSMDCEQAFCFAVKVRVSAASWSWTGEGTHSRQVCSNNSIRRGIFSFRASVLVNKWQWTVKVDLWGLCTFRISSKHSVLQYGCIHVAVKLFSYAQSHCIAWCAH